VAEYTLKRYAPGDDSEDIGRCDLQLVQDACYAGRLALQGAQETPEGDSPADACKAVSELLDALQRVLTGLAGDVRCLARNSGAVTEALSRVLDSSALDTDETESDNGGEQ
jgi:hypothetical protein